MSQRDRSKLTDDLMTSLDLQNKPLAIIGTSRGPQVSPHNFGFLGSETWLMSEHGSTIATAVAPTQEYPAYGEVH